MMKKPKLLDGTMKKAIESDGPFEMRMKKQKDDADNVNVGEKRTTVLLHETTLHSDASYQRLLIRSLAFIYQIPLGRRLRKMMIVWVIQMAA